MKTVMFIIFLTLTLGYAQAQDSKANPWEVKLGSGLAFHGTGDIITGNVEVEAGKKFNRILSSSAALNLGYGFNTSFGNWYQKTYYTHLDANIFASPFGNQGIYNFKLGTGPSLLYVRDVLPGRGFNESDITEDRLSLGFSVVIEQEVRIRQRFLLGLKFMTQPYLNGDIVHTLSLKAGALLY